MHSYRILMFFIFASGLMYMTGFITTMINIGDISKLQKLYANLSESVNNLYSFEEKTQLTSLLIGGDFEDFDTYDENWSSFGSSLSSYYFPNLSGYPLTNISTDDVIIPDPLPFPIPDPGYVLLGAQGGSGFDVLTRQHINWDTSYTNKQFVICGLFGGEYDTDQVIVQLMIQKPNSEIIEVARITVGENERNGNLMIFASKNSSFPDGIPVGSDMRFDIRLRALEFASVNHAVADSVGLFVYL